MFLKSIKLFGVFDIDKKEHEFVYLRDKKNSSDYINTITDQNIINAIMYVFDLKYDHNYDFKDIISKKKKGDSYVEICLYQNKGNKYLQYDWLIKNELKIKRDLRHPNTIYINKRRHDISKFHQALINLGFHKINNFWIHRLMDEDIAKMSMFSGSDFWNMLMKIIEHEELIEMIEQKSGVIKQRAIQRSFKITAEAVKNEIPKKAVIRNAIYEKIQLNKNFYTLCYISNERNMDILESHNKSLANKISEIMPYIFAQTRNRDEQSLHEFDIVVDSLENFLMINFDIKYMAELYGKERDIEEEEMIKYLESIAQIKTTDINDHVELDSANDDIAAMKFCIAKSIENDKFEETKEILNLLYQQNERFLNIMDTDDIKNRIVENEYTLSTGDIEELEEENLQKIIDEIQSSPQHQLILEDKFLQINKLATDLKLSKTEFYGFLEIERLLMTCSEEVKNDYIGPVYQYLNSSSNLDVIMWNQISTTVKAILFQTSKNMEIFISKWIQKNPIGDFTFYAIENFPCKEYDKNIHDTKDLISMKKLIREDIESEQLKNVLHTLFHKYILIDGDDWIERDDLKMFCVKSSDRITSFTSENGIITVENEWHLLKDFKGESPIAVFQEYYKLIKEYLLANDEKNMKTLDTQKASKNELNMKKAQIINREIDALSNKIAIKKDNMERKIDGLKRIQNEFSKLLTITQEECEQWNLGELIDSVTNSRTYTGSANIFDEIDTLFLENSGLVRVVHGTLSKIFVNFENLTESSTESTLATIQFLNESRNYENIIDEKLQEIKELQDSFSFSSENFEEGDINETTRKVQIFYAMITFNLRIIQFYVDMIYKIEENLNFNFKQSLYDEFKDQEMEVIKNEAIGAYKRIMRMNKFQRLDLKKLNPSHYENLIASLGKVQEYSEKKVYAPLKVKKRAYPFMNSVVVNVLKDITIKGFTISYNAVLSDYINYSHLFFYTMSALNETNDDNFSWNCFDITRLKAIDFVEEWKNEKRILSSSCRQLIKGLLLILHIINYISVFKFIVISERLFEGIDAKLADRLRRFLKNVSPFVQIILYKPEEEIEESINDERDYLSE